MTDTPGVADTPALAAAPERGSTSVLRRGLAVVLAAILVISLMPLLVNAAEGLTGGDLGSLLFDLLFLVLPLNLGLVGIILTIRRSRNPIGWLLLISGVLAGVTFAAGPYGMAAVDAGQADAPLVQAALWIASWAFIPAVGMLIVILPLIYPNGELLSPRWRVVVWLAIVGVAAGTIGPAVLPGPMGPGAPVNPFGASDPVLSWIEAISGASNLVAPPVFLLALASLLIRFRRSGGIERQQIKWFLFVTALATIAFVASFVAPPPVSDWAWAAGLVTVAALPIAIGLAILRYGLYEIDRIVNRALVYGAVTAILAGVFAAATSLAQRVFISVAGQSSDVAIVLETLVVVAVYAPVRKRVEAVIDRYFKYDQRAYGPYLDELRRLLELVEPHRAGRRLAREAMRHTGATGVAVVGRSGAVIATPAPGRPSQPRPSRASRPSPFRSKVPPSPRFSLGRGVTESPTCRPGCTSSRTPPRSRRPRLVRTRLTPVPAPPSWPATRRGPRRHLQERRQRQQRRAATTRMPVRRASKRRTGHRATPAPCPGRHRSAVEGRSKGLAARTSCRLRGLGRVTRFGGRLGSLARDPAQVADLDDLGLSVAVLTHDRQDRRAPTTRGRPRTG